MTLQLDIALKLCKEWNAFTFKLPLVDTVITFGGLDWKYTDDYDHGEHLTVMTPDGEHMQWSYNRNDTLQGYKTTMGEKRLEGLKPILEKLQARMDDDIHYEFCDNGHLVRRRDSEVSTIPDIDDLEPPAPDADVESVDTI